METDNEQFDLHNCFDFSGFTYDIAMSALTLRWLPNAYGAADERRRISVTFEEVSHLSVEPRDVGIPFTEDNCLMYVAYAFANSPVGEIVTSDEPSADMHLIFCFMSHMRLRVYAELVQVTINAP